MSWEIFQKKFRKKFDVMVIGHRGSRYEATENSLPAFELAVDSGAEMVEFDVHKTIDGHVVVIHDKTTARVSDADINIHQSTLEQVREVSLKGGEQIPTLDELFSQFKDKLYFQIEVKQKGIASDVISLIDKHNLHDQCIISSFLHNILPVYKELNPNIMVALLALTSFRTIKKTLKFGLDGYHPDHLIVTPELVSKAHSNNLFVNTWTSDNEKEWAHLINCGVDGIMTNYPRELYKFLDSQ